VVEYWVAGLTWAYGVGMIGTRVCRAGLSPTTSANLKNSAWKSPSAFPGPAQDDPEPTQAA
jgi:hypothetical protein